MPVLKSIMLSAQFFNRPFFFFLLFLLLLLFLHYLFPDICPQTATHFSRCRSYISFLHDIFSDFLHHPTLNVGHTVHFILLGSCASLQCCADHSLMLSSLLASNFHLYNKLIEGTLLFHKVPNSRSLEI